MDRSKQRVVAMVTLSLSILCAIGLAGWSMRTNAYGRAMVSEPEPVVVASETVAVSNVVEIESLDLGQPLEQSAASTVEVVTNVSLPLPIEHVGILNPDRQFALGMIETANNDREVGRAGEVSRYQIMPSVWKRYSRSRLYQNPQVSLQVAQQHWLWLYEDFKRRAKREPTDFDMYVLWNTRYHYYSNRGFEPTRLGKIVRDRAQRFVNLVERGAMDT